MDNNNNKGRINFTKYLIPTLYEYFLIILPVLIYVSLESMHKGWFYLLKSPEWSIASIFLSFQGTSLYMRNLNNEKRKINNDFLGILILIVICITIYASINAYNSLIEVDNTINKIILRLSLVLISTIAFFILVIASKISNK